MEEIKRFEQAYWRSRASADNRNYAVDVTVGDAEAVLAELTRLQTELAEARRHAKALMLAVTHQMEKLPDVDAAIKYAEGLS